MTSSALQRMIKDAEYADHAYAWVITRDRFTEKWQDDSGASAVGVTGPSNAADESIELARTTGRAFRMLDEGDIDEGDRAAGGDEYGVVYEGLIWTVDEPGTEADFGPLVDFGTPDYGCVTIEYRNASGAWQAL